MIYYHKSFKSKICNFWEASLSMEINKETQPQNHKQVMPIATMHNMTIMVFSYPILK